MDLRVKTTKRKRKSTQTSSEQHNIRTIKPKVNSVIIKRVKEIKSPIKKSMSKNIAIDYGKESCKDFRETGYCTFGDACIFIHDREDLHRSKKKKKVKDDTLEETSCGICQANPPTEAVKTECGHLFCEKCILNEMKRKKECFTCYSTISGTLTLYSGSNSIDMI